MDELFILSNSPGEVSGWVKPVLSELLRINISAKVYLIVLPCQYASGMEKKYGREIEGIEEAFTFKEFWSGRKNSKGGKKLVMQLGGDPLFGAMLSARLRGGWMIYTSRPRWRLGVEHYFIPDIRAEERFKARGMRKEKYTRVGNLILDSVPELVCVSEIRKKLGLAEGEEAISFLPGSRPFEYRDGFAFFSMAAQEVLSKFPGHHAFLPVAPTVDEKLLTDGLDRAGIKWSGHGRAEEIIWGGTGRIRLVRGHTFEAIRVSKLAVALPGTNNLQIAAMGVPLIVVAPLNEAENIPLDGIPGIIPESFPYAKKIKKKLVLWYNKREKFLSLPNRLTDRRIVPEHRYVMTPDMVAGLTADILRSPETMRGIIEGYSEVPLERGAAAKIADKIAGYYA